VEKGNKKKIGIAVKVCVSLGLVWYLLEKSDVGKIGTIVLNINIWWLICAMILYIGSQVVSSWRWWVLLGQWGRLGQVTSLYFIGCFFNSFMPTGIGGDGVKTYYLFKRGVSIGEGMASVFMDRYLGMGGMLIIGTIGYALGWESMAGKEVVWIWPGVVGGYLVGSMMVWGLKWGKIVGFVRGFYEPLMGYKKRCFDVRMAIMGALGVQILGIGSVWVLGNGIGIDMGFRYYAVAVPVASILTMIPVSISGIGIREGALVYMLGFFGIGKEQALALSVTWFVVMLVTNMIGGIEFIRRGMEEKRTEVE